jgi:hypothetical protein
LLNRYQIKDGEANHEGMKISLNLHTLVENVHGRLNKKSNQQNLICDLLRERLKGLSL